MKTSNKLLMFLLALILIVPLLIVFSFKSAISNNKYVVKTYNGTDLTPVKIIKPFKVLKIETDIPGYFDGINELLKCTIKKGDKFGYKFTKLETERNGGLDSKKINYRGDTLIITYAHKFDKIPSENYYFGYDIDVYSPVNIPVIVNKATVITDADNTLSKSEKKYFTLSNNANLVINGKSKENNYTYDSTTTKALTSIPGYNIQAIDSKVSINGAIHINHFNADFTGTSSFSISDAATIDTLSGNLSDKTIIKAPYSFVKKLKSQY